MLLKKRVSKHSRRRWTRVILFGSILAGASCSAHSSAIAQVRQLVPPQPGYRQAAAPAVASSPTVNSGSQVVMAQAITPAPLTYGNTSRLHTYDVPSAFIGTVGAQLQIHYHANPEVRITTDPKTGQLMIMAPDVVHAEIASQINGFMRTNKVPAGDRGVSLASAQQQGYNLRNLSWRELEDAIGRLVGNRLTVTTERNGELANLQIANTTGANRYYSNRSPPKQSHFVRKWSQRDRLDASGLQPRSGASRSQPLDSSCPTDTG